jgi:hypothetical protein
MPLTLFTVQWNITADLFNGLKFTMSDSLFNTNFALTYSTSWTGNNVYANK